MDHAGAFSADPVCVMRRSLACTGAKVTTVVRPLPLPLTTGFQVVPSSDASTLYWRGKPAVGAAAEGGVWAGTVAAAGAPAATEDRPMIALC